MSPSRPFAATFAVACVSLSPSLLAQSAIPKCAGVPWSESIGATGSITKTVTGEFVRSHTNDRAPDVALLKGGRLCLAPSVDSFGAQFDFPGVTLNDIAAPPPATSGTAVSSLYAVSAAGLQRIDFTLSGGVPYATLTLIAGGTFAGASRLQCADLNGDNYLDFAAIDAAKDRVVMYYGGEDVPTYYPSFDPSPTETVLELTLGRFLGSSSSREIALQLSNSFSIHTNTGTALRQIPGTGGSGKIATEVNTRIGKDRVIWLTQYSGTNYALLVAGNTSATDDPPVYLGPIGARALAAGDMDRDGDSEALFVCDALPQVLVFDNLRSVAYPSIPAYSLYSGFRSCDPNMGSSLTGNVARPVVVDLDSDTDGDVLHFAQNGSTRQMTGYRNESANQLARPHVRAGITSTADAVVNGALQVTLHADVPAIAGCDRIEVAVYRQDSSDANAPFVPDSVLTFVNPGVAFDPTFVTSESSTNFNDIYSFVIRRVPTSGTVSDLTSRPHLTWGVVGTGTSTWAFQNEAFMTTFLSFASTGPGGNTGGSGERPNIIPATGSGGHYPP